MTLLTKLPLLAVLASCGGSDYPDIVYAEHIEPPPGLPARLQIVHANLYTDLNNGDMIITRDCTEDVWFDSARILYESMRKDYPGSLEFRNKIIFSNKVVCEVLDVSEKIGD